MTHSPIIVAIDSIDFLSAKALIKQLDPRLCRLKIGKGLFTLLGPAIVDYCHQQGFEVFLDLKFHDIPNTVAHAIKSAATLGVWMVNVHALGGENMMLAAREAIDQCVHKPKLIAVTVLTSLNTQDMSHIGFSQPLTEIVSQLLMRIQNAQFDGVVCSAHEAHLVHTLSGHPLLSVCPGIRLATHSLAHDDQQRTMTPQQAIANHADYLVIGRPITQSVSPSDTLVAVASSINVSV